MCGRFGIDASPDVIEAMLGVKIIGDMPQNMNISPSQSVFAITQQDQSFAREFEWGFKPAWMKSGLLINAKAETVMDKPTFKDSFKSHRCAIPATCFYEWKMIDGKNTPFKFSLPKGELFLLAGVFDQDDCFVVLTTTPNALVKQYHSRMPVMLTANNFRDYLTDGSSDLLNSFGESMVVVQQDPLR